MLEGFGVAALLHQLLEGGAVIPFLLHGDLGKEGCGVGTAVLGELCYDSVLADLPVVQSLV